MTKILRTCDKNFAQLHYENADDSYSLTFFDCDNTNVKHDEKPIYPQNQKVKTLKVSLESQGKYYLCFGIPRRLVNATIDKIWLE